MRPYGAAHEGRHQRTRPTGSDLIWLGAPSRYGSAKKGTRRSPVRSGVKGTMRRALVKSERQAGKRACREGRDHE